VNEEKRVNCLERSFARHAIGFYRGDSQFFLLHRHHPLVHPSSSSYSTFGESANLIMKIWLALRKPRNRKAIVTTAFGSRRYKNVIYFSIEKFAVNVQQILLYVWDWCEYQCLKTHFLSAEKIDKSSRVKWRIRTLKWEIVLNFLSLCTKIYLFFLDLKKFIF